MTLPVTMAGALAIAVLGFGERAGAQVPGGRCALQFVGTRDTRLRSEQQPGGRYHSFIGGGFTANCKGQEVTLQSDSAESYEDRNIIILIGNVKYREKRANLDSKRLTYYLSEERLYSEGDVVVTLPSGTVMKGPIVEYFRAGPAVRATSRMWAPQRSTTSLVQRDSTGKKEEPVVVEADRTASSNDSLFYLGGRVHVTRTDIYSTSDSARIDNGSGFAQLLGSAVVRGKGTRAFTLESSVIDLFSREQRLERVVSKGNARATGEDFDLSSDTITMQVDSNQIQRAQAWGKKRALVVSPGRQMIADSLDILMPRQRLREVHALRGALAESEPDSTKIRTKERDWIRGDTLFAVFDSVPPSDTTSKARIRRIIATGQAKSYHQVAANGGRTDRPAINYVRGRLITVRFDSAAVQTVQVDQHAVGVYLEPTPVDTVKAGAPVPPGVAKPSGAKPSGLRQSAAKPGSAQQSGAKPYE